jgi:hypothetical protein
MDEQSRPDLSTGQHVHVLFTLLHHSVINTFIIPRILASSSSRFSHSLTSFVAHLLLLGCARTTNKAPPGFSPPLSH